MPIKLMVESSILSSAWTTFLHFFCTYITPPSFLDQNQPHRGPPRVLTYYVGGLARVICFVDVLAG